MEQVAKINDLPELILRARARERTSHSLANRIARNILRSEVVLPPDEELIVSRIMDGAVSYVKLTPKLIRQTKRAAQQARIRSTLRPLLNQAAHLLIEPGTWLDEGFVRLLGGAYLSNHMKRNLGEIRRTRSRENGDTGGASCRGNAKWRQCWTERRKVKNDQ